MCDISFCATCMYWITHNNQRTAFNNNCYRDTTIRKITSHKIILHVPQNNEKPVIFVKIKLVRTRYRIVHKLVELACFKGSV